MNHEPTYFHLKFRPNIALVSVVRQFVMSFYTRILGNREAVWQLALATHELLENAVSYAGDEETEIHVEVHSEGGKPPMIRLRTRNRAREPDIAVLRQKIEAMQKAPDPFEHYQEQMRISQKRTDGSGLGLVRIFAEADMRVDFEVQDDLLTIMAETTLKEGG